MDGNEVKLKAIYDEAVRYLRDMMPVKIKPRREGFIEHMKELGF